MTKAERAACLRAAAIEAWGSTAEVFDALPDNAKAAHTNGVALVMIAFLRAAAGLPNPEKLVAREATEIMCQAMHAALYKWREAQGDPQADPTNPEKHAIRWTAAHDAAPKWEAV